MANHDVFSLDRDERQKTVMEWADSVFGPVARNPKERCLRLVEEVAELAQAEGVGVEALVAVLRHVYTKPSGEAEKELGAVCVCVLAYAEATGWNADTSEAFELSRILAINPDHFRERQRVKAAAGVALESP